MVCARRANECWIDSVALAAAASVPSVPASVPSVPSVPGVPLLPVPNRRLPRQLFGVGRDYKTGAQRPYKRRAAAQSCAAGAAVPEAPQGAAERRRRRRAATPKAVRSAAERRRKGAERRAAPPQAGVLRGGSKVAKSRVALSLIFVFPFTWAFSLLITDHPMNHTTQQQLPSWYQQPPK